MASARQGCSTPSLEQSKQHLRMHSGRRVLLVAEFEPQWRREGCACSMCLFLEILVRDVTAIGYRGLDTACI